MNIHIPPGVVIDPILRANRANGTTFHLATGDYFTHGHAAFADLDFCMLAPGCSIIGAGQYKTHLRLMNSNDGYSEILTGGSRTGKESPTISPAQMVVADLTVDASGKKEATIGVHLWTEFSLVERVGVRGIGGDRTLSVPNEGFGILLNNGHHRPWNSDGGHCVRDCVITASSYATACYVGCVSRPDVPMSHSLVERVQCLGRHNAHAAFAANQWTTFRYCNAEGFTRGLFMDTDSVGNVVVSRGAFRNIAIGLEIRGEVPGVSVLDFLIQSTSFQFAPQGWGQAFLLVSLHDTVRMSGVRMADCTFRQEGKLASKGRMQGPGIQAPSISRCRWEGAEWQDVIVQP